MFAKQGIPVPFIIIRLLSSLSLLGLVLILSEKQFDVLFYSFLFTHFILSFYYMKKISFSENTVFSLCFKTFILLASIISLAVYNNYTLFICYFGMHSILTDNYLYNEFQNGKKVLIIRFLLNFLGLFLMIREFQIPSVTTVIMLFYFLIFFYLGFYLKEKKALKMLCYEMAILPMLLYGLLVEPIKFRHFVFYHVIVWFLYPIYKKFKLAPFWGRGSCTNYVLNNLFLACGLAYIPGVMTYLELNTYLWAYVHITSSFAFSDYNPNWVLKTISLTSKPKGVEKC